MLCQYSVEHKFGGGIIGGFLAYFISCAFDVVGAYIINIIGLIICFVCITGKSAIQGFKNGGKKVYASAKESNERYQEYRKAVAEERKKNRRLDKKVSGVSIGTKIVDSSARIASDEMGELQSQKLEQPTVRSMKKTKLFSSNALEVAMEQTMKKEAKVEPNIVGDFIQEEHSTEGVQEEKSGRKTKTSIEDIEKAVDHVANEILAEENLQKKPYVFPPMSLLKSGSNKRSGNTQAQLRETAQKLELTLKTFGVNATVTDISCGQRLLLTTCFTLHSFL